MSINDLESTPDRVIEAAGHEFADKGFDQATVRDICQRAGANLAAVNYHFGDKHKLYVAAVTTAHRWILSQTPLPNRPEGTPAQECLDSVDVAPAPGAEMHHAAQRIVVVQR